MPHAQLMPRSTSAPVGVGDAQADQLLVQAQANITLALPIWQLIGQMMQNAINDPNTGGAVDAGYAAFLKDVSLWACKAASLAVQASQLYAKRCSAAAQAALGARQCPGLDISNETAMGTPWGVVWNGRVNMLDPNLVPQVGAQVSQAQASIAAAQAARNVACPTQPPPYRRPALPVRMRGVGRDPTFSYKGPRIGLGQVPQIVQNLGDSKATSAFQNLYTQMQQEYEAVGQTNLMPDIGVVASDFVNSYGNVAQATSDLSVDVVGAATSFVGAKGSISSAITIAEGFAEGVATGSIPDIVNAFEGVAAAAVSAAVAAGAVSAGIGAAIVIGLTVVAAALDSLFGGSPPKPSGYIGTCPFYGNRPNIIIPQFDWSGNQSNAFCWSWGNRTTSPGSSTSISPGWRRFPDPNNSADAPWFQSISWPGYSGLLGTFAWQPKFSWAGDPIGHPDDWYSCHTTPNDDGVRPIDHACYANGSSIYNHIASEMFFARMLNPIANTSPAYVFSQFQQAFYTAWKSNREYGFNGNNMLPDFKVLQHAVEMWNKSRSPSQTFHLMPSSAGILDWKSPPMPVDPYESIILANAFNQLQSSPHFPLQSDGSLFLNAGPSYASVLQSKGIAPPQGGFRIGGGLRGGASPGMGAGTKALIGLGVAVGLAAAAEGYYAWHKKIGYTEALKRTWDASGGRAVSFVRRHV